MNCSSGYDMWLYRIMKIIIIITMMLMIAIISMKLRRDITINRATIFVLIQWFWFGYRFYQCFYIHAVFVRQNYLFFTWAFSFFRRYCIQDWISMITITVGWLISGYVMSNSRLFHIRFKFFACLQIKKLWW